MRAAGDPRTSRYDAENSRLEFTEKGKPAGVLNVVNLFGEYLRIAKAERATWLKKNCVGLLNRMEVPEDFEDAKPDLLPTIRPRAMLDVLRLDQEIAGSTEPTELAALPLSEHLVVCLAYDLPNTMQLVNNKALRQWGASAYEAGEIARHNLEARPFNLIRTTSNLYVFECGDAYDSSRMLMLDKVRDLEFQGKTIAIPITRNCLMVTGSEELDGLGQMAEQAESMKEDPRPLCSIPHMLDGDEWHAWQPPADHPHYAKFRTLELRCLFGEYAEQKQQLEKLHEKTGLDVFVATFSVIDKSGRLLSWCVWSKGIVSWLPKTDFVGLYDPDVKAHRFARWDRMIEVASSLMKPLDLYPPRWAVDDFPSEEQFGQMAVEDWSK
ncbi:MAG TPA: hypothetical protein VGG64_28270 [Pirellulales bacterium]